MIFLRQYFFKQGLQAGLWAMRWFLSWWQEGEARADTKSIQVIAAAACGLLILAAPTTPFPGSHTQVTASFPVGVNLLPCKAKPVYPSTVPLHHRQWTPASISRGPALDTPLKPALESCPAFFWHEMMKLDTEHTMPLVSKFSKLGYL